MADPRVLYKGKDLVALGYIDQFPDIVERKGFGRGNLVSSGLTLTAKNIDNQFSVDNPASFLNGVKWQYEPLIAYDTNELLVFSGIVQDIPRNHQNITADIICLDAIFENRKTPISYISSDWETPGNAAKNLMDQEGLEYDSTAINNSINILDDASCKIKANFNREDELTLFGALEKLGLYGGADVYMKLNKLVYETWKKYTGGVSLHFNYTIQKERPNTRPLIKSLEQSFYNDYSIGYDGDGGTPATDSNSNVIALASRNRYGAQSAPEMHSDSTSNNQIVYKDKASAVFIGELLIRRGHYTLDNDPQILKMQNFDVPSSFNKETKLGKYFDMTFAAEAWDGKNFEIAMINRSISGNKDISIEGWEIAA